MQKKEIPNAFMIEKGKRKSESKKEERAKESLIFSSYFDLTETLNV